MMARLLFAFTALLAAACGGGVDLEPQPFTRERADGKIPVKTELIREQVRRELAGMPEGESEVIRWQAIETDYHACRLSSGKAAKAAEQVFADCMAKLGYVYMYRIDAEQLHNDIEFEMEKNPDKIFSAERKAEEDRRAAEKKRREEAERARRQKELNDALVDIILLKGNGRVAEVKRLINDGANVNIRMKYGFTLLHIAAGQNKTEVALALVKAGAYIDAKTEDGWIPLHAAAREGQAEIARALIEAGAYIDTKDNKGWTPLHYAAAKNQIQTALVLVKAGASLVARTNSGAKALDVAIQKHGKDSGIALFLRKAMEKQGNKGRQEAEELLRELE